MGVFRLSLKTLIVSLALGATPALAQESGGASAGGSVSRSGVLTIEALVIQGNVEKPQVQYFISREKIRDVTPLDLKESFLSKIVEAVEKEPF